MFIRAFLSTLVVGLLMGFSGFGTTTANAFVIYEVEKPQRKYIKRAKPKKARTVRRQPKKNIGYKSKRIKTIAYKGKKRRIKRKTKRVKAVKYKRKAKKKKAYVRYVSPKKKATKASLSLGSIKNSRHARLTRSGRMSVAKDTRKRTVRNFGSRVSYKYRPGTIVISNYTRRLYYVVRRGKVISYPIATPRPNEVWSGSTKVSKKKLNPDWYPTPAMREQNPDLPEKVVGGSRANPFGKRALYLGSSLYRIHGTNRPGSIGKSASGGCYRMRNGDISKLWRKVRIGTPVVVLTKRKI